jgi:hypothetical protein
MSKKEKGGWIRPDENSNNTNCILKDTNIIDTIKNCFCTGKKYTAIELNRITHSNDARKAISTLTKNGWHINKKRLPGGYKLYWLTVDDCRQLNLFEEVR